MFLGKQTSGSQFIPRGGSGSPSYYVFVPCGPLYDLKTYNFTLHIHLQVLMLVGSLYEEYFIDFILLSVYIFINLESNTVRYTMEKIAIYCRGAPIKR